MNPGSRALTARAHGRLLALCTCFALALTFALFAGTASAATDWDGDGYTDTDCAPLDPAVHPGAVDKPDLALEDTNCDGIDGDKANAIFVSLGGNDAAPGTLTNPMRTINAAIAAAAASSPKEDVYIAGGNFTESVNLADGVGLYGGYEPITGARGGPQVTTITGAPAVTAFGDKAVLQMLTLIGQTDGAHNAYGLRAVANGATPSRLVLADVTAKGLAAGAGVTGGSGFPGANGNPGNNGLGSCVPGLTASGPGGAGGAGGAGGSNAPGIPGAGGQSVSGALGGFGGTPIGGMGGAGATGGTGSNNPVQGPQDVAAWALPFATAGLSGGPGAGGGGGQGGAGSINFFTALCGGGGGSGGSGGGGGGGGTGGQNGGGSFGAYIFNSSVAAIGSDFIGGTGGKGGNGGAGGIGGAGGQGGFGGPGDCVTIFVQVCGGPGANGGFGGPGGRGGGGGAGSGGPSAGVYQAGLGSSFAALNGTTEAAGTPGAGGVQGNTGSNAPAGQSAAWMRSATAPATSTADFDGDGINDSADACPDVARGTDGGADGCPARPAKVVDANGNGIPDSAETASNTGGSTTGGTDTTGGSTLTDGGSGSQPPPPRMAAQLLAKFKPGKAGTKVMTLMASRLRKGDAVKVTCTGKGCTFKTKKMKVVGGKANMLTLFKKRALAPKAIVTVSMTRPGTVGQVVKFTFAKGKSPKRANMCMPIGGAKPRATC